MKASDFSKLAPGILTPIDDGVAFVPAPLPPNLPIDWNLALKMSEADRALSELAGVARMLPNPHLLIRPFIGREAVLSSRIEGTRTSLSELLAFEGEVDETKDLSDLTEVANYVVALEYGLARLESLPVSNRLIKEMHQRLMSGVRGENLDPGNFRRIQNWIGVPGASLKEATFVPPPVPMMNQCMDALERYINSTLDLPPLIRLAITHYQIEAIHPFIDGNGRIGRLLITMMLCSEKLLPQPLLYLSAYFERYRKDYYDLLLSVSQRGNWVDWISFFLRGVTEQATDASKRSRKIMELWKEYRDRLQVKRASAVQFQALDFIFSHPVFSAKRMSNSLSVTQRSAQLNIEKLVQEGILKELTGRQRNRIYSATELFGIIDAPTAGD